MGPERIEVTANVRILAEAIAAGDVEEIRQRFLPLKDERAIDLAVLLDSAYPALGPALLRWPEDVLTVARSGLGPRDPRTYRRRALATIGNLSDTDAVRANLRRFANREKMRIAARELLPGVGSDVDVTARELSDLADVCLDIALREAALWAESRFGLAKNAAGGRCEFVIMGMGKLGGRELNAGSDVDLIPFYETDEGVVEKEGQPTDLTLHEYFARIAQRMTTTMEEPLEAGIVWRVDWRLRPEGSRGALVNALTAAERYYEAWGRTWERAAFVRARPVAGDLPFGERVLEALSPFIWRRNVNPKIADEMLALLVRGRAELSDDPARDLKLGPGGIREAEFFVQALQLIWGGREPKVRSTNTLDALRRLRSRGYVTDHEAREVGDAYLVLRRLEHRIQFATGLQTHALPTDDALLGKMARSLGFAGRTELEADLERTRTRVGARLASLTSGAPPKEGAASLEKFFLALDSLDESAVLAWLPTRFGTTASPDLSRHLLSLSCRPDAPLGAASRDHYPELAPLLLEALSEAADPDQATRLMAAFFARLLTPSVYVRALAEDPRATRRLAGLFGASAFLGESAVGHPELVDRLLFGSGAPDPASAKKAVDDEVTALPPSVADDPDEFVGALRRAKRRVTMEVGLADLAGELGTRECTFALSALADATLAHATRFALREKGRAEDHGLAVVAMGKLGGREIGYGSDLDLFFVYDELGEENAQERFIRVAQRVLRLLGTPHGEGPGYDLDTRLRPSGNQGLLVVSVDAFAAYQERAEDWERQALVKARFCAGDAELGLRVEAVARTAAYERGAPPPEKIHHLRMRMEKELAAERSGGSGRARYDLKVGRGGLVDVEFATQWLQMKFGPDPRVRTADTEAAITALETFGYLDPQLAAPLRDGYRFLRQLEQRVRVHHATSSQLIEEGAPGLAILARRVGMRDGPRGSASEALLAHYVAVTSEVRAAYLAVLGVV